MKQPLVFLLFSGLFNHFLFSVSVHCTSNVLDSWLGVSWNCNSVTRIFESFLKIYTLGRRQIIHVKIHSRLLIVCLPCSYLFLVSQNKELSDSHIDVPDQFCGSKTFFLCKNVFVLRYLHMAASHMSEKALFLHFKTIQADQRFMKSLDSTNFLNICQLDDLLSKRFY